jgi:hypothetical protein
MNIFDVTLHNSNFWVEVMHSMLLFDFESRTLSQAMHSMLLFDFEHNRRRPAEGELWLGKPVHVRESRWRLLKRPYQININIILL